MAETTEKILQTIEETNYKKNTQAEKINTLILKQKSWLKLKTMITNFKEPIMYFERRDGNVEFHENVTTGKFSFNHSDGHERFIILDPHKQKRFGVGQHAYKGYYCHEDHPLPLPYEATLTTEEFVLSMKKILLDQEELDIKKIESKKGLVWVLAGAIALVIGAVAFYQMVVPTDPTPIQPVIQVINNTPTILG